MSFERLWTEIRTQAEALDADTVLVTPSSERAFVVDLTDGDRLDVHFRESGEQRTLWRDQFAFLYDQLRDEPDGLSLADLPAGVEPYVSVLSLASRVAVDESAKTLRFVEDRPAEAEQAGSPFVRPEWEVRTTLERLADDALLLADLLERLPLDDLESLPPDGLVNLYVLLSDVQRAADRLRRTAGEELLGRIGPDDSLHGQFGSVRRTRRERHRPKDAETVFEALDGAGIPREWVVGVDRDKLDVVLAVTDLDQSAVYDVEEQVYVRKADIEEDAKQSRLQGLVDRLGSLDTAEAESLRDEIERLESRLDHLLATG